MDHLHYAQYGRRVSMPVENPNRLSSVSSFIFVRMKILIDKAFALIVSFRHRSENPADTTGPAISLPHRSDLNGRILRLEVMHE